MVKSLNHDKAFIPRQILPAGKDSVTSINPYTGEAGQTRKGIITATLNNIALLNIHLNSRSPNTSIIAEIKTLTENTLDSLKLVGIFDIFTPEEWISDLNQPGRVLVGAMYLKKNPSKITVEIRYKLIKISRETTSRVLANEIFKLQL